jgi:soluble lytic murein transglycosylase
LRPALFLYSVAEFELAGTLLNEVIAQKLPQPAVTELADLSRYHGQYNLLQRIVANHFLGDLRSAPARVALPWMDAYPQAYWDVVLANARQGGIDPFYALSIMREESHFRPAVESASGALGLMQLMPPTAQQMAKAQRLPYDVEALTTPEGNIPLGVAYLARMIRRFDGDLIYATAAYNAGPGNVKRWLRTMGDLRRDVFVESLPFEETQRYVKRVYGTYLIYQELYR